LPGAWRTLPSWYISKGEDIEGQMGFANGGGPLLDGK